MLILTKHCFLDICILLGVSCDSCRKNNFMGLRYKCLVCFDYDLCSTCYEAGLTSSRHTVDHPMQCILVRSDYDLYYSGEAINSEQPQSLTCPFCGGLGYTEATLLDHVTADHSSPEHGDTAVGVVCPICGGDTNQLTFGDFATHLTMEHRTPRDLTDQVAMRGSRGGRCHTRTGGARARRTQTQFNSVGGATGSSPSARDAMDPLAELLSQLSGRGRTGTSAQSPASQLHQLQMQLQSSPSFARSTNDREVRIMRRTFQSMNNNQLSAQHVPSSVLGSTTTNHSASQYHNQPYVTLMEQGPIGSGVGAVNSNSGSAQTNGTSQTVPANSPQYQFLLSRCTEPILNEAEQHQKEVLKADRSLFVQELLMQIGKIIEKTNQK